MLASETRLLDSKHTGRQYHIIINLPLGYFVSPEEGLPDDIHNGIGKWPTVYMVDGNYNADMIAEMIRITSWGGRTTDAIVVGIGYRENNDQADMYRRWIDQRTADLTPVRNEDMEGITGDAGKFLKFIKEELVPIIEAEYAADPAKRILAGHSFGGLFGAYTLLTEPELFPMIVMGSPTLSFGKRHMFQLEEDFAKTHQELPVTTYLYAGELEESMNDSTLSDMLRFGAILQGRHYKGFSLASHMFLDQNHTEVMMPGIFWGIKQALRK